MQIDVLVEMTVRVKANSSHEAEAIVRKAVERTLVLASDASVMEIGYDFSTHVCGEPVATAAIPPKAPLLINDYCLHPSTCATIGRCKHFELHGTGCETAARGERKP